MTENILEIKSFDFALKVMQIKKSGYISQQTAAKLISDNSELTSMLVASIKTTKNSLTKTS